MLGKSVGHRAFGIVLLNFMLLACAHNVSQDKATAADGKVKGAKELQFENGEAVSRGIVTYPGGDRVDWKVIEVPDKKAGDLDFRLTWSPPRPGLLLGFDVFDEWNTPVASSKKAGKKSKRSRSRSASLKGARGKYFVRIYAVERGDAGKYKLTVEFKEAVAGLIFDPLKLDIPEPPKLADVPGPEATCDEFTFDMKNPACKMVCPSAGAPPGWPACKGKCPTPPSVDEPSCHATMPCPKGQPDERIKACKITDWPSCPNKADPDLSNPRCREKAKPVIGRALKNDVSGSGVAVVVGVGSSSGVTKEWKAQVLRGDGDQPFPNGDGKVIRVDKNSTTVIVGLTTDQVSANPRVKLSPP